jgi:hypothetical protein
VKSAARVKFAAQRRVSGAAPGIIMSAANNKVLPKAEANGERRTAVRLRLTYGT